MHTLMHTLTCIAMHTVKTSVHGLVYLSLAMMKSPGWLTEYKQLASRLVDSIQDFHFQFHMVSQLFLWFYFAHNYLWGVAHVQRGGSRCCNVFWLLGVMYKIIMHNMQDVQQ